MKKVENNRTLTEFRESLKEFRPRRGRKREEISQEDWLKHFKRILGGTEYEG